MRRASAARAHARRRHAYATRDCARDDIEPGVPPFELPRLALSDRSFARVLLPRRCWDACREHVLEW